jgi:hypothetical protein
MTQTVSRRPVNTDAGIDPRPVHLEFFMDKMEL